MVDPKDSAEALTQRAALTRMIKKLPPGKMRDMMIRQRDRIPLDYPGPDEPGDSPPRPRDPARPPAITRPWRPDPSPIPGHDFDPPELPPCVLLSSRAHNSLAAGDNRYWQNWGKTRTFIAERMLFPTSVYELSEAIIRAEADNRPVRAVGGGWSFSDVNIPGDVTSRRPFALGVEAMAELVPLTETFSTDSLDPVIASVAEPPAAPPGDSAGSLAMFNSGRNAIDTRWTYRGGGVWTMTREAKQDLLAQRSSVGWWDPWTLDHATDAEFVEYAYDHGFRPVSTDAGLEDGPGSLVIGAGASLISSAFFYNGNGMWTQGPLSGRPSLLPLKDLRIGSMRPRRSTPAFSMSLLLPTAQPAYLINTQSMASSLQQFLPSILSEAALRVTTPTLLRRAEKHYFHVEGGITMAALSELLERQSPRLAIQATGGNPGATLAGSLATATHGGEHNRPLLSDRVLAVHLVGPGGLQWWIEGDVSVADPDKLLARYPCLARERIITAASRVGDLDGQDWLDAVVVSLGCMGAVYSMVLEVVPLFGIHEAVVETTWVELLARARFQRHAVTQIDLRNDHSPADRRTLGGTIVRLLADGTQNGTNIPFDQNVYVDLAIDPNPIPMFDSPDDIRLMGMESDWNCWVLNREQTPSVPFDPKPAPKDMIGRIGKKLGEMLSRPDIAHRLQDIFNVDFIRRLEDQDVPIDALIRMAHQLPDAISRAEKWIRRLLSSTDTIDAALDILTGQLDRAGDSIVAGAFVSAVFSGLLGIEDGRHDATASASKVGAIGFPASGIMGTAIEIALREEDAWPFLQTEILDRVTAPFFGYISVRICPAGRAHLGMQQFAPSVMIEVVAFGTGYARRFVDELERRTVERIRGGLDAMLHWGLENERLDAEALRTIPALNGGSTPKLAKFLMARAHLKSAAPTAPAVFDSAATRRLGL